MRAQSENGEGPVAIGLQGLLQTLTGAASPRLRPDAAERRPALRSCPKDAQPPAAGTGERRKGPGTPGLRRRASDHLKLLKRFWFSASGFWHPPKAGAARALTALLLAIAMLQLLVQYSLNVWNRGFFDAIGRRDGVVLLEQTMLFVPLAAGSVTLAVAAVWGRMTMQRCWRAWLSEYVLQLWMTEDRWKRLQFVEGEHENPEFRIAEDVRIATDAPVDLALGFLASLLTALTFIHVLWTVGGSMTFDIDGISLVIPGYLVVGALAYSFAINGGILLIGRELTAVVESKNRTEARFRAATGRLRESAEGPAAVTSDFGVQRRCILDAVHQVISAWRALCNQLMRVTIVSNANTLLAPVVGLALAAPQYLAGGLSLGELAQASAAFVLVSGAFNWVCDNYPRLADWSSSAHRVAHLLLSLDQVDRDRGKPVATAGPKNHPQTDAPQRERSSMSDIARGIPAIDGTRSLR